MGLGVCWNWFGRSLVRCFTLTPNSRYVEHNALHIERRAMKLIASDRSIDTGARQRYEAHQPKDKAISQRSRYSYRYSGYQECCGIIQPISHRTGCGERSSCNDTLWLQRRLVLRFVLLVVNSNSPASWVSTSSNSKAHLKPLTFHWDQFVSTKLVSIS